MASGLFETLLCLPCGVERMVGGKKDLVFEAHKTAGVRTLFGIDLFKQLRAGFGAIAPPQFLFVVSIVRGEVELILIHKQL